MRVFFAFCKDALNDQFLEANVHMEELSLTVARHCGVFKQSVVKTLLVKGKTATRRKICAALNKEKGDYRRTLFVLPLAEGSIAFVWTSAHAGAQPFTVCGALPHTLFFLNFLITPRFWYSYSLSFSVLCVAE